MNAMKLTHEQAREYWFKKQADAMAFMEKRKNEGKGVLIEVAAQHPLNQDGTPAAEFSARLDEGARQYFLLKEKYGENYPVCFYIPGNVHGDDKVALSDAGREYLVGKGVCADEIFGLEMGEKYKGGDGVYNSADECFVATSIFRDGNYQDMYVVCSPNQTMRNMLFYIEFGLYPKLFSTPVDKMFHNFIGELLDLVPAVVYEDHSWQSPDSIFFIDARKERRKK